MVESSRRGILLRIGGVDAVHLGGLQQAVGAKFESSEACAGIGGEERVAGSGHQDHHSALVQVAEGTEPDERLGDRRQIDRRHASGLDALAFKGFLEGDSIDHGAQHPHVVGGGLVDGSVLGQGRASDDVSSTTDHRHLDAALSCLRDL